MNTTNNVPTLLTAYLHWVAINYNRALRAAAYSGQYAFVERMLALGADQLDDALVGIVKLPCC